MSYIYLDSNSPPATNLDPYNPEVNAGNEIGVTCTIKNTDQYNSQTVFIRYRLCTVITGQAGVLYSQLKDSSEETIVYEVTVPANGTYNPYKSGMVIPTTTDSGATYGIQVELYESAEGYYPYDTRVTPAVFEVIGAAALRTGCTLFATNASGMYLRPNEGTRTISGVAPNGLNLASVTIYYIISEGSTLSIGGVDKTSPMTVSITTGTVFRITAEAGNYKDYTTSITQSVASTSGVILNGYSAKTSVSPDPVGMGGILSVIFTCLNDGTTDVDGDEGFSIPVYFKYDGAKVFDDYINITKAIPKKPAVGNSYTEFRKDIQIPSQTEAGIDLLYGVTYTIEFDTHVYNGTYSNITDTVKIVKYVDDTMTKVYSEKENLFAGNRRYKSAMYFPINNDLFAMNPSNRQQFYLMDSNTEVKLWGSDISESWDVTFVVQVGIDAVIFKTIDIELSKLTGGSVLLKKIEYQTNRQSALQEPFYSETDADVNPWNPVYKDEKWHLPVRNEYDDSAIIPYKKLKGTYLRITLTGQTDDQIILRNVVTKILKIFN